ncbi:2-oxoglutarate dehydrogenase E1 component [Chryseosolibacter indicus]|uniref:oxoglutarate dehydrogenase (succinyl-transferring) n=1 Tax=Chryseosolibacter indicus TaxID=2782351 RepID=A0ABS5VS62_9BACT|nr:2-oxoglutarate dehydrogenase E1 component [Chryseosolibacter indicus]MBT1704275.1 2-oxoglutarate dehydrogenase E1 component [Chryseosolibacter indicus]
MDNFSYISNADVGYIDQLYQNYKKDPLSVDQTWQKFFEGFDFSQQHQVSNGNGTSTTAVADSLSIKETQVRNLIFAYRSFGHLASKTNPVRERRNHNVQLDHQSVGLTDADLDAEFDVAAEIGMPKSSLRKIIEKLKAVYLGPIGFEYNFIRNDEIRQWFFQKCEQEYYSYNPNNEEKKRILGKLNEAVVFENFLHTKFIGQKRFSLEGGENTIPALHTIINKAAELDVKEVVIGMAHRGRLNVLSNILGKTYEQIFTEFEGNINPDLTMGDGDVKYHLGYASHITSPSGKKIYVKLTPNPSHLEAVDPLVIGYTRGQIDDEYKGELNKGMAILIHGDAAVAGQGIVYEVIQMSGLPGYTTGGTIHFVINNQVGFTTDFDDARTSIYCTDIAKIVDAPVLHVNGDDAEAVNFCANLAVEYRQKFGKDIFVDLLCYRRHGHNESDEPKFTQPKLYNLIAKHDNPREIYVKKLIERGDVDAALADEMDKSFRNQLQDRLNEVKQKPLPYKPQKIEAEWEKLRRATPEDFDQSPDTSIKQPVIEKVGKALITIPEGFKPIKQIEKLLKDRQAAFFEEKQLGWAEAELLAYGSLLLEGTPVRMSGQDVKRGTFSHRHAYIFDANTNAPYCCLDNIEKGQKKLHIYNSLLSEFGVLGFEYGYAMSSPHALVIWEAQFGDFVNGAQVMIDQFISSAESKWQRMNGLVMLLPHGYEGQGPEHSSARPERFLQLSAEYNMVVAYPTTPANFFHLLRRQVTWPFRKPCIVFSPKSLLRHPAVISPLKEFTDGNFIEVIDDPNVNAKEVKKIILCTGKVFYDLQEVQLKKKIKDAAIVRIEQLHPWPEKQLQAIQKKYKNAKVVWVQEEPANMGYWSYIRRMIAPGTEIAVVSRKSSASPATGYAKVHKAEQEKILNQAFEI